MKKTNILSIVPTAAFALGIALSAASTGSANAQTPTPAPTAKTASQPTQIVFVPKKMLEENRVAGKLKENTFYWSNIPDDPNQGPKVEQENGTPYLLLKGAGTKDSTKSLTVVTLIRAYNVPPNATTATITAENKVTYDEWIDKNPGDKSMPTLTYSFFKDGVEARKNSRITLPTAKDKAWKSTATTVDVPSGAQQLVIVGKTDFPSTIGIAALDVTFK